MNRQHYRIIFNARRGMRMAVAETATAQGKQAGHGETPARYRFGGVATALTQAGLLASLLWLGPVSAQVMADRSAPANQQPTIVTTANGTPQVNIQTPSAAGVSRNTYSQFDVSTKGVILNNSRTDATTQIGGYVQGNPWLATGSARVILNEVNSSNPSKLNGYVEVAGQRAEVIVANPAGIAVNGGGFLNAGGVTLTTGTTVMNNGALTGVQVRGGNVSIDGGGLDTSGADYTNILARAVQVNASIWAKNLTVAAGVNDVSMATASALTVSAATGARDPAPGFAIDVSSLGGMYAGQIYLVGTEAGLGIRNAGTLGASAGNLTLSNNGWLQNSGKVLAAGDSTVAASTLDNQATAEISAANTQITVRDTLINRGLIDGGITSIQAPTVNNTGTGRIYGDVVAIAATTLTNEAETVGGSTSSATVAARQNMVLGVDILNNTGGASIFSNGDMAIGKALSRNGNTFTVTDMSSLVNNQGSTIEAVGNLAIASASIQNIRPDLVIASTTTTDAPVTLNRPAYWRDGDAYSNGHYNSVYYTGYDQYYLDPSSIVEVLPDVITADGVRIHRVLANVAANDTVLTQSWGASGDTQTYALDRATVPTGTRVIYFTTRADGVGNPDRDASQLQGPDARSTLWSMVTPDPVNYGKCASNCVLLQGPQGYFALNQFLLYDGTEPLSITNSGSHASDFEGSRTSVHTSTVETISGGSGQAAVIRSGAGMRLTSQTVHNEYAYITAGADLEINGQSGVSAASTLANVTNTSKVLEQKDDYQITSYAVSGWNKGTWNRIQQVQVIGDVPSVISGNQTVAIAGNVSNLTGKTNATTGQPGQSNQGGSGSVVLPSSSIYRINTNPNYLVETDSRFTNYRSWLSSDYITQRLTLDPTVTQKRLGDGFYEQNLVRDQVAELSGRRFLGNYQSDEQQYMALMNAGIAYAQQYNLRPGVALSAEQIKHLTSPIVWLEQQTVQLPGGGTQSVLVPRVYVSSGMALTAQGALIAGNNVSIAGDSIQNVGGFIQGQDIALVAGQDVINQGGKVQAQGSLTVQAGRDIVAQSTTDTVGYQVAGDTYNQTRIGEVASFEAGLDGQAGSTLNLSAGRDIKLGAAKIANQSDGTTALIAQVDVNLESVQTSTRHDSVFDAQNTTRSRQTSDNGSSIQADGDLVIVAGNDIHAKAASIQSNQDVALAAGRNITLEAGQDTSALDVRRHSTDSDGITSKTSDTHIQQSSAVAQVNHIGGQNVSAVAGNALASYGTQFQATQSIDAGGDNQTLLYATQNVNQYQAETHSSSGILGINLEDKTTTDSQLQVTSIGTSLVGIERIQVRVGEKAELQGATLQGQQINFVKTDPNKAGELILGASKDTTQTTHTEKTQNAGVWQEAKGHGSTVETLNQTQLKGNVTFEQDLRITVQISKEVQATPGGQRLQGQMAALDQSGVGQSLASSPDGLAYLEQLKANPNVKWDQVALANEHWSYDQSGLTPAGAALLSIAVAAATGGTASSLTSGLTSSAAVNTALAAGIVSLSSQAAVAMVNNGGDIGKTLAQLGSEQSVKGLITAMVAAGALQSLDKALGFDGTQTNTGQMGDGALTNNTSGITTSQAAHQFQQNLLKNITNNVAGSAINAAISGKPFDENTLSNALSSALITAGMAAGANAIGDARVDGNAATGTASTLNDFTSKIAHAVLGCAGGAAIAGNASGCGAGAVGAVVGEIVAEYADKNGMSKADALGMAKVVAAAAGVLVGGGDNVAAVNIAATTGANAAENNYLKHAEALRLDRLQAQKAAGTCDPNCERDIADLKLLDAARNKTLENCTNISTQKCIDARQEVRSAAAAYIRKTSMG